MQVGSYAPPTSNLIKYSPKQEPPPPPNPEDGFDTRRFLGGAVGGGVAGFGLGYLGLRVGMEIGLRSALGTFGPSPAGQLVSVFVPGIQYMVLGGALGAGIGAATGVALGGYLGCTLAAHHQK